MWKKLAGLYTLLRTDLRATGRAWRHPATPFWFKAGVVALIVYFFSPIDLLPEALLGPLGLLDDIVFIGSFAARYRAQRHALNSAKKQKRPRALLFFAACTGLALQTRQHIRHLAVGTDFDSWVSAGLYGRSAQTRCNHDQARF